MGAAAWNVVLLAGLVLVHLLAIWQAGRRARHAGWVIVPVLSTCLGLGCAWLAMEKPHTQALGIVQQWPAAAMCR